MNSLYAVFVPTDNELARLDGSALYQLLDDLELYRRMNGRGRSEQAAHVRIYCKSSRQRIEAALRAQKLPIRPPERPWRAWWAQKQKGHPA
jgi:hypothetical protein